MSHHVASPHASEIRALEVDAYSSVHDMIHAAIVGHGPRATLREIYRACEARGRIAYKRSGGSRLITHNEHWKSQIRHALYTCPRFVRAGLGEDFWTIAEEHLDSSPTTCKVIIRGDDDPRGPQTPGPTTVRALTPRASPTSRRPPRAVGAAAKVAVARGVATRNQQARAEARTASTDSKPVATTTKGRRSRSTRPAARFAGQHQPTSVSEAAEETQDTADISNTRSASCNYALRLPESIPAAHLVPYALYPPTDMAEGEDESSHTGSFTRVAPASPQRRGGYLLRGRTSASQSPQPKVVSVSATNEAPPAEGSTASRSQLHRPLAIQAAQQPADHLQRLSEMFPPSSRSAQQDALTFMSTIRDRAAGGFRRAGSAEAESPPSTQAYTARLRSATPSSLQPRPHSAHVGTATSTAAQFSDGSGSGALNRGGAPSISQRAPTPPKAMAITAVCATPPVKRAATPSLAAASEGPIKKRFKAAAKAQAAADAAAQEANSAVGTFSLLAAAVSRPSIIERCGDFGDTVVCNDLLSTAKVVLPFKQVELVGVPECNSPSSASDTQQQQLDTGPAAAALERRRGLRARPSSITDCRQPQLLNSFRSTAEQVKSPPPRYDADPVAASAADDVTTATATATPFAMSVSQAGTSSVAQRDWHLGDDRGGGLNASADVTGAAESTEPRRQLRSQVPNGVM